MQSLWLQVSLLSIILNPSPSVPYSSLVGKKILMKCLLVLGCLEGSVILKMYLSGHCG